MMKKKLIIGLILIILLTVLMIFVNSLLNQKIYLSDKYYNKGEYIDIDSKYLNKINKDNYLLFTYNSYCTFKIPCENIFKETMDKYKIDVLSMPIEEFKKTDYYKMVKYAPSVMVIKKGKIKSYLDPNSDSDLGSYQNSDKFEKWLSEYIYLKK